MSKIPSSRGSASGIKVKLQRFNNTSGSMVIGNPITLGGIREASIMGPVNVRDFDEVVLNINCIDNFGDVSSWPAFATPGWKFAEELQIQVFYSTMVDLMEDPPPWSAAGTASAHWAPLLLEEVVAPFTGSVDVAKYSVSIKDIQVGAEGGAWSAAPMPAPTETQARVERPINLRIPTTMAEWIAFSVAADTSGTNPHALGWEVTAPVVEFSLYRGLPL